MTVSRDFLPFFLLKIFDLGKNSFASFFVFVRYSRKHVPALSTTTLTLCQRSRWLLEVDTFGKLWRFLTGLKEQSAKKRYLRCVYTSNSNNLKISKESIQKIGCPRSRWLRWHPIFELCHRISPQKRKILWNRFLPVHMGPR